MAVPNPIWSASSSYSLMALGMNHKFPMTKKTGVLPLNLGGYRFGDAGLLSMALTHRSVRRGGNERLEFLGDRVLGLVIAEILYRAFPMEQEGALARRLARLVSRPVLAKVGRNIGLDQHMVFAQGEETGGRNNPALIANGCEAVIGAIYLDGGLPAADQFIRPLWTSLIEEDAAPPQDAKTALQEWAQGRGLPLPHYHLSEVVGPAHNPIFTVEVSLPGFAPAEGRGRSKRSAEQVAAALLLGAAEKVG